MIFSVTLNGSAVLRASQYVSWLPESKKAVGDMSVMLRASNYSFYPQTYTGLVHHYVRSEGKLPDVSLPKLPRDRQQTLPLKDQNHKTPIPECEESSDP